MLDVITDFWKPVKKQVPQEAPDLQALQLGTQLTFGTVPQALLSGAKFRVSTINTYQFGEERMTSFVLSNENEDHVTLIVANADGEQYLAISRRIPFADRMRMFDPAELEAVAEQPDATRLICREIDASFRSWMVSGYRKEISGLRGSVRKGDFRAASLPADVAAQPFDYVLLTSDSNEYAIEIERYADGRLEVYATIYRRTTDIVEMENGPAAERKTAAPVLEVVKSEPAAPEASAAPASPALSQASAAAKQEEKPVEATENPAVSAAPAVPVAEPVVATPVAVPDAVPVAKPAAPAAPAIPAATQTAAASPSFPLFLPTTKPIQEKSTMSGNTAAQANGSATLVQKQEIKAVNNNVEQENDAIECDLRAANKIIDEAIRNEMRMSDVVRRIIALPVANPDSVQIPVVLTEADFQLLAIRYGLPASDHDAIKNRIIDEINEFSGGKKQ